LTLIDPITGLLNTNINGQLDLGGGVIVNIASIPVSGQRTTFVRTSVGCTSGSNCVVGISDVTKPLTKLNAPVTNSRLFWREIPTFKTK
jgi:hypothetical protein